MAKKKHRKNGWTTKYKIVDGLELNTTRTPKPEKELREVPKALALLGKVLNRFEYRGTWEVRFLKPTSKKGELFKAVKRDSNNIHCRIKLGNMGNSWEIVLIPPAGNVASEVYSNLLAVDPHRLFLREAPQAAQEAVQEPPKVNGHDQARVEEEASEATEEAEEEFTPHKFLTLDPAHPRNLKETDDYVIDRALVVCAILANPEHKAARRQDAIAAISRELGLNEFVSANGGYQTGVTAARSIVMALCNKALMARHFSNGAAAGTTTHYMLGPPAEDRLTRINMPRDLRKRLFTAETICVEQEEETPEPEIEEVKIEVPSVDIAELSREYQSYQGDAEEATKMVEEAQAKYDGIPSGVDLDRKKLDLKRKLKEHEDALLLINEQWSTLADEKKDAATRRKSAKHDLDFLLDEQKTINRRVKELKQQITEAL